MYIDVVAEAAAISTVTFTSAIPNLVTQTISISRFQDAHSQVQGGLWKFIKMHIITCLSNLYSQLLIRRAQSLNNTGCIGKSLVFHSIGNEAHGLRECYLGLFRCIVSRG